MDSSAGVGLTYANDRHMDGAGAQLQRIYGIYAISRFCNLPYVHSIHETIHSDLDIFKRLDIYAKSTGKIILIRVLYPYSVTDRNPEIYQYVKAVSPFQHNRSKVFRLALHVRRGEEFVIDSERMLPNSYYVACALKFIDGFKALDIPFVCELYTEVASKPFVVTPQHHGIEGRIRGNVTIDPQVNRLEDFDILPNLVRFINGDPIDTLRRMATADALVLSRSSYSYVAAILNANCIVVYHPFWHSTLTEWLTSDASGSLPGADLIARLKSWKRT